MFRLFAPNKTRKSAIADYTARRKWNVKRASFLSESVPLGPNFTGTGSIPAKMFIPFDG